MTINWTVRLIAIVAGVAIVIAALLWGPAACQKMRSQVAQAKVDRAQGDAFSNSVTDGITVQSNRNQEERASEDVGRTNQEDIRHAEASGNAAAVTAAGFRSLCKRASFRATESGKLRCPHSP